MTQAGARLDPEVAREFADAVAAPAARRFVAHVWGDGGDGADVVCAARRLAEKAGSIGIAIPGGRLAVERDGEEVDEPGEVGELVYEGPNVMLGYADRARISRSATSSTAAWSPGDLGYRDEDGFFFVTGRLKRFAKVFGLRVNLDDIERACGMRPCRGDRPRTGTRRRLPRAPGAVDPDTVRGRLAERFKLNSRTVEV